MVAHNCHGKTKNSKIRLTYSNYESQFQDLSFPFRIVETYPVLPETAHEMSPYGTQGNGNHIFQDKDFQNVFKERIPAEPLV